MFYDGKRLPPPELFHGETISDNGSLMIGSGTLRLSFKISVFYTLRVSQHVEYQFAGEKKQSEGYSDSYA